MTKQLNAHIAELQKVLEGPNGKYWAHGPAVRALIAALEQSNAERNKAYRQASAARNAFDEQYQLRDTAEKRIAELEARPLAVKLPERIPNVLYNVLYRECEGFVESAADTQVIWVAFKKYFIGQMEGE